MNVCPGRNVKISVCPGWDSNPQRMVFETIASYLLGYRGRAAPGGAAEA